MTRTVREETWVIDQEDPLSATGTCRWTAEMSRGDWSIRTVATASIACAAEEWIISAEVEAFEGEASVHTKSWSRTIRRDYM